ARVIVGREPRFLGETFCSMAAEILAGHGITPLVIAEPAPTPAIAYAVIRERADGAINFTASHNPAEYNGIKFSTPDGAPALPEVTAEIEAEIARTSDADASPAPKASYDVIDPREPYLARLRTLVPGDALARSGLRVAVDPRFGTSRGYLDEILKRCGADVAMLNGHRDPYFGGLSPQCDEKNLGALRDLVVKDGRRLGLATDGDADRFGVLDADGKYINPNLRLMLLAESV